jgi:hypothetical protein
MRKLGKKMSETVITDSMEIWRTNAHEIESGTEEMVNRIVVVEIEEMNQEVAEFENGLENQIEENENEKENGAENMVEEPKDEEENEIGLAIEI